jgi:hypothetical protein
MVLIPEPYRAPWDNGGGRGNAPLSHAFIGAIFPVAATIWIFAFTKTILRACPKNSSVTLASCWPRLRWKNLNRRAFLFLRLGRPLPAQQSQRFTLSVIRPAAKLMFRK